jgi:hypothetical protein
MKTQLMDSPAKRMSLAAAVITVLILVAAAIYLLPALTGPLQRADGLKIVGASRLYTRDLIQRHLPVPQTVHLQALIDQGLLKPADIGPFQGMDATIYLTASSGGDPTVMMRVRMPDGADFVLLTDGTTQEIKR